MGLRRLHEARQERPESCDGAGNPVHDVGVTGLALLAFLGDGSTMRSGPYKDVVKKAVKWLRKPAGRQRPVWHGRVPRLHLRPRDRDLRDVRGVRPLEVQDPAQGRPGWHQLPRVAPQPVRLLALPAAGQRQRHLGHRLGIMAYKSAKDFKLQVNGARP